MSSELTPDGDGIVWKGEAYRIGDIVKFRPQNSSNDYSPLEQSTLGTLAKITGIEAETEHGITKWYLNIIPISTGPKYKSWGYNRWHPEWWILYDQRNRKWKQNP